MDLQKSNESKKKSQKNGKKILKTLSLCACGAIVSFSLVSCDMIKKSGVGAGLSVKAAVVKSPKLELTSLESIKYGNSVNMILTGATSLYDENGNMYMSTPGNTTVYYDDNKGKEILKELARGEDKIDAFLLDEKNVEKYNEKIEQEAMKKLQDFSCYNLNFYKDQIMYTKEGKVYVADKNLNDAKKVVGLEEYKVDSMYVIQDEYIIFSSGGRIYQYSIDNNSVYDYDKANIAYFIPTASGMLYIYKTGEIVTNDGIEEECYSLYAEEECIVEKMIGNIQTDEDVKKVIYQDVKDQKMYSVAIEDLFEDYSEDKVELYEEFKDMSDLDLDSSDSNK